MIKPHQFETVDVARIEVDPSRWNAVRLALPPRERRLGPADPVFPVFSHADRLVLLAGFEDFLALLDAGAPYVKVWRARIDAGEKLEEYAIALSMHFET